MFGLIYLAMFGSGLITVIVAWWLAREILKLFSFILDILSPSISVSGRWIGHYVRDAEIFLGLLPSRLARTWRQMRRRWRDEHFVKVFLSSTYLDLQLERFLIYFELKHDHNVIGMEHGRGIDLKPNPSNVGDWGKDYGERSRKAQEWSKSGVVQSDIIIYLMGERVGSMRESIIGQIEHSLTEFELHWAREFDKPVIAYRLKRPLDDDEKQREFWHSCIGRDFKYEKSSASEYADEYQQVRVAIPLGTLPWNMRQISSGTELVQRVRRDVEKLDERIKRNIRMLQATLAAYAAWSGWATLQVLNLAS